MAAGFPQSKQARAPKAKDTVFLLPNLRSDIRLPLLNSVRSKSLGPARTLGQGVPREYELQEAGITVSHLGGYLCLQRALHWGVCVTARKTDGDV